MSSKARLGSFNDLLEERVTNDDIQTICEELRRIIFHNYPEATEVVRLGDGAASYGVGPKKMSESHVYIMPKERYVNLGFWHGTSIPDPANLLEGTGKKMRHVKIRSLEAAASNEIATLISEALKERRAALGLA
ncbi:MAG: DUF1801 domain-containing protein [Chloroflexota bacterium]